MNQNDYLLARELAGIVLVALSEYAMSHPSNLLNAMIYAAHQVGVPLSTLAARLRVLQQAGLIPTYRGTSRRQIREARRRAEAHVQQAVTDYFNE